MADTIKTDKNGVAKSRPLPLGRYKIVESKSADFYGLDKTPIEVEIEYAGQIVKAAMTNKSLYTNVSITKRVHLGVHQIALVLQLLEVIPPGSGQILDVDITGRQTRTALPSPGPCPWAATRLWNPNQRITTAWTRRPSRWRSSTPARSSKRLLFCWVLTLSARVRYSLLRFVL